MTEEGAVGATLAGLFGAALYLLILHAKATL